MGMSCLPISSTYLPQTAASAKHNNIPFNLITVENVRKHSRFRKLT